jgi:hypothetical protein
LLNVLEMNVRYPRSSGAHLDRTGPALLQSHVGGVVGELRAMLCEQAGGRLRKDWKPRSNFLELIPAAMASWVEVESSMSSPRESKAAPPLIIDESGLDRFRQSLATLVDQMHSSAGFWTEALGMARRVIDI